ncbi:MAG TPA: molybdopterin-dependent oxidoreductase [Verrucomicrobiales bacterium]|nr:molybdopterin-dependent oxidoreductase [Verrucomicrobiales bacterium]
MSTASPAPAQTAPPVDLVNVQVNGKWMKFPKGTRMIEALRQAEVEVPHYCYHPKLSSPGNCRMCLVETGMPARPAPGQTEVEKDEHGFAKIMWSPRAAIACANTVSEGIGIRTESTLVQECRKGVMEFLLINHPLDCPICDQAGECRLQEFSVEHGRGQSRFLDDKVKKPKNNQIGPRITLDDERCIMCSRCIRFTDEIADDPVLGFTERGSHTVLTVHPDKELANNYSLNTVDICPVGALTSTDFRFSMRVWFLKETKSICTGCARGCNTEIASRNDIIHRQTPRQNNDVNSAWMCDTGRLDFHWVNSERRLTEPLVKENGKHRPASWKEAVQAAAEGLRKFAAGQIAVIASGRMTNEELFLTRKLAAALGVGAENVDIIPRSWEGDNYLVHADRNPNTNGAKILLTPTPGGQLNGIRERVQSGQIRAVVALRENLLNAGFTADDLGKLGFLAQTHVMLNAGADAANVVLPCAAYAEKRGSMINATGRLQRLNQATVPPGQAHDDWEILRDLILAVSGQNGMYSIDDVFRSMASETGEFSGLTLGGIGDGGIPFIQTGETIPLLEKEKERKAKGIIVG